MVRTHLHTILWMHMRCGRKYSPEKPNFHRDHLHDATSRVTFQLHWGIQKSSYIYVAGWGLFLYGHEAWQCGGFILSDLLLTQLNVTPTEKGCVLRYSLPYKWRGSDVQKCGSLTRLLLFKVSHSDPKAMTRHQKGGQLIGKFADMSSA
jgi:hypothetical protein